MAKEKLMAKKSKKDTGTTSIEKVSIEFTLKLDSREPAVKFFNVLGNEAKQEILKRTVYSAIMNSGALVMLNADNSWAELNLSPLKAETNG